jgi:hypothetical protein
MVILTEEQAKDLLFQDTVLDEDGEEIYFKVQEEGWIEAGKYSHNTIIFSNCGGHYYELHCSKSGSYYSDYHYEFSLNCPEVKQVKKMIEVTEWERVK